MTEPRKIRYMLMGLGNIGRNLLDIYVNRQEQILADFGLEFVLVAASDSQGAAVDPQGLDQARIRDMKLAGKSVSTYAGAGKPGMTSLSMVQQVEADLLMDASPTSLTNGEPGMSCIRAALSQGMHVVMANKGPLVLAFDEVTALAESNDVKLLYSGTVAGGLPTVNIGVRDMAGSGITRVEGIFNGTTNYILTRMEEEQISYEEALKGAQEAGIAEADPTLDVDGWDLANKLVIIANSALGRSTVLDDLTVEGIRQVTLEDLQAARAQGKVLKLMALAEKADEDWALSVAVTPLSENHPLARIGRWDMAVVYHTDYMGIISAVIEEKGPVPTSAAVLRDMINIYRD